MFDEYENKKKKQVTQMKSMKDYSMGVLILVLGLFFIFHEQLKMPIGNGGSTTMEKVFGGLCIVYGVWRIYRGYKKNYFQ